MSPWVELALKQRSERLTGEDWAAFSENGAGDWSLSETAQELSTNPPGNLPFRAGLCSERALQGDETVGNLVIPFNFQLRETL